MIYPAPSLHAYNTEVPFIMAIHDLQHRLQPHFPEVGGGGEADRRESLFRAAARNALVLLADSDVGREDIVDAYASHGASADRVKVLPFVPPAYCRTPATDQETLRVRKRYDLPSRYFFYPAQFWPHKNHLRVIEAFASVKSRLGTEAHFVFCGSHEGELRQQTFRQVVELAEGLDVVENLSFLDYVPDADMPGLYGSAMALVFPTFFGPTNIPVLEAWATGCPVLTSDIRGIREQAGDAAVLVDPSSAESIAEGMHQLWTDEQLRRDLVNKGGLRAAAYTQQDFDKRFETILNEVRGQLSERG